ncbi:MAG: tetratricopeptide repeat protein [SAR202 cluster bacterium]|nr:tetratricopeptide repeat protein [SAR202 cluster bacterium]
MADIFQYLVLFSVAVWTARLAKSKGRNPWGWGGVALLLSILPINPMQLFGVVPVLVLLFIKNPTTATAAQSDRTSCPRCAKSYSDGQHFCTGCGWDLSLAYSPEDPEGSQLAPPQMQAETQAPLTATAVTEPVPEVQASEAQVAEAETAEVSSEQTDNSEQAASGEPASTEPASTEPAPMDMDNEEEPEKEYVPWGTYDVGVAPTAAVMTERGMARFNDAKYQEAIDQFTKAIALDPNYAEAWQRRAEAYAQLGRSELAAEDRRHLQGLDPSSSLG